MNSKEAVEKIISDMTDRGGGDGWWYSIDKEIRAEITSVWEEIVQSAIDDGIANFEMEHWS